MTGAPVANVVFGQNVHTVRILRDAPGDDDRRAEADGYETVEVPGVTFFEGRATPVDVRLSPKRK